MKLSILKAALLFIDALMAGVHFGFIAYCVQRIIAGDAVLYYAGLIGVGAVFAIKSFRDCLRDND